MQRFLFFVSIIFLFASCDNKEAAVKTGFSIIGKINHVTDKTITLSEITPKGLIFIDTAVISPDGSFELNGQINEKVFCTINFPKGALVLVVDSNSHIILSVDADNPNDYTVSGSDENTQLKKILQVNTNYMEKVRDLGNKYAQYGEVPPLNVQDKIRTEYDSLMTARKTEISRHVLNMPHSIVPYFATNFLMPEADFDLFSKIDNQYYNEYQNSKYAQELHAKVEKLKRTAEGQQAPDIVLSDPYGKTIALSSLRGKIVLVDFWASWCGPCRKESPNLVKMYNKYKSKGFDVFSVSLDDNRDAWVKAINDDHLLWTHVSDLMKWNASVVGQYNIESIPFTVLIDKEGKIIAKNLRGKALESKLDEVFED